MAPSQIDLTLGAVLLGASISAILYGVVTVQLYIYSGRCQKDPKWLISLVYTIWILETLLTVLSISYTYDMIITHFGDPQYITHAPWMMGVFTALQVFVSTSVQSFFAYRVYKITNWLILPCVIWLGSLTRFGLSMMIAIVCIRVGNISTVSDKYTPIITSSFSISVALDILNVGSLTWALLMYRKSVMDSTSRMVDKMISYAIETGLITSITGICMLVTTVTMPNNFVWLGIFEFYAKLYSNTFMASLNARDGLRHKYMNDSSVSTSINGRSERSRMNFQMVSFTETTESVQK